MQRPLPIFLALRYSRSRSRSTFTRFISHFVAAGITLGVMALIIVTSVMNGFENELKARILGIAPQVTITPQQISTQRPQALAEWQQLKQEVRWPQQVQHVSPYVQSEGIAQGHSQLQAVLLQGVYPHLEPSQNILRESMLSGQIESLRAGEYRLIIGRPLAELLDAHVGDRIRITAAAGQQHTPLGVMPAQRQFRISGIFEVGADIDQQLVLMHGDDLARLLRYPPEQVSGLRLWLDDAFQSASVTQVVQAQLTDRDLVVQDWQQRFGQLFAAVRMEKGMMMIMLGLIIIVAAFNAVSALIMLIQDKRSDIAILQTLGMAPQRIYITLVLQGMYSGVVGVVLGTVLGLVMSASLNQLLSLFGIHVFSAGMALPVLINYVQVLQTVAAALLLTLLATLYPAWRAAQIQPAEILRYE